MHQDAPDHQQVTRGNMRQKRKIGTWNVRTLNQDGKLENVIMKMKRLKLDILGLSEVRWTNSGVTRQ